MSSTCTTTTTCCSSAVKTAPLLHGYTPAIHIHAATVQSSVAHWLYIQRLQDPAHPSSAVALLNDNALDLTSEQLPSVLAGAHVVENDKPLGAVTGGTLGPVLVAFTTRGVGMVWDLRAVVRHVSCVLTPPQHTYITRCLPSSLQVKARAARLATPRGQPLPPPQRLYAVAAGFVGIIRDVVMDTAMVTTPAQAAIDDEELGSQPAIPPRTLFLVLVAAHGEHCARIRYFFLHDFVSCSMEAGSATAAELRSAVDNLTAPPAATTNGSATGVGAGAGAGAGATPGTPGSRGRPTTRAARRAAALATQAEQRAAASGSSLETLSDALMEANVRFWSFGRLAVGARSVAVLGTGLVSVLHWEQCEPWALHLLLDAASRQALLLDFDDPTAAVIGQDSAVPRMYRWLDTRLSARHMVPGNSVACISSADTTSCTMFIRLPRSVMVLTTALDSDRRKQPPRVLSDQFVHGKVARQHTCTASAINHSRVPTQVVRA